MVAAAPVVRLSCKNSSTGPTGQLTGSIVRAKHQDSKTPHLEEYSFLVAGALALAMVSWTSTGRLFIKALGPVWAIPTTSKSLAEDARSCPEAGTAGPAWSESPKGADTGGELAPRTKSGRARIGLWEGNGHCPQGKELALGPEGKTARKPILGAQPWTPLTVYVGHYRHIVRSDYYMMLPKNGEKMHQSQEDSSEFQVVYVPGNELSCPFPVRRSAFEDRAPACHWCVRRDHMATVNRIDSDPTLEESGVPPL